MGEKLMHKVSQAVKYDMSSYLRLTLIIYAFVIGIVAGLPTLMALISSGTGMTVASVFYGMLTFTARIGIATNVALLFYFGFATYERFAFLIQNGISRRTGWLSKIFSLVIISVVASCYNLIFSVITVQKYGELATPYMAVYGKFFQVDALNYVGMALIIFLLMWAVAMFGMVVGAFFALFSKQNQRRLLIGIPVLGTIVLAALIRAVEDDYIPSELISAALKFVMGITRDAPYVSNPIIPGVFMIVLITIALVVSRWLNSKLRIKRGE
jgi:hypothetical protein